MHQFCNEYKKVDLLNLNPCDGRKTILLFGLEAAKLIINDLMLLDLAAINNYFNFEFERKNLKFIMVVRLAASRRAASRHDQSIPPHLQ